METVFGIILVIIVCVIFINAQNFVLDRVGNTEKPMYIRNRSIIDFFTNLNPNLKPSKVSDIDSILVLTDGLSKMTLDKSNFNIIKITFFHYNRKLGSIEYKWEFLSNIKYIDIIEKISKDITSRNRATR